MQTYDPARVQLTLAGKLIIGFAETFIRAALNADLYTTQVGAQGDVTRSRSQDRTGTVTLTLMAGSPSNDVLSALAKADEEGLGVGVLQIVDLQGTTLLVSPNAWISKKPEVEFGKESGERVWVISCDNMKFHVGGLNP